MLRPSFLVVLLSMSAMGVEWQNLDYSDLKNLSYPALIIEKQGQKLRICQVVSEGKQITNPRHVISSLTLKTGLKELSLLQLRIEESRNVEINKKLCWYRLWADDSPLDRYVLVEVVTDRDKIRFETFECASEKNALDYSIDLATYLLKGHWADRKSRRVILGSSATFEVDFKCAPQCSIKDTERVCAAILARLKSYYPERHTLDALLHHALETGILYIVKCPGTDHLYFLDEGKDTILFELLRCDHDPFEHRAGVQKSRTYESRLHTPFKNDPSFNDFKSQSVSLLSSDVKPKKKRLLGCFPVCW